LLPRKLLIVPYDKKVLKAMLRNNFLFHKAKIKAARKKAAFILLYFFKKKKAYHQTGPT
jgi:hypothetical protein